MEEQDLSRELFYSLVAYIIIAIILIIMAFKTRDLQDRLERLENQIVTEQSLEQPTTEVTSEATTEAELHKEPSDDEIVILIIGED